jgi:diguanylate cyclase (GGDEF)-like protein
MAGPYDDDDEDASERTQSISIADLINQALPEARRLTATLTCIAGKAAGRVYRLDQAESVLGRLSDLVVMIEDEGVSRRHATIERTSDDRHILRDLGSRNGTIHNGVRIEDAVVLRDGDRIRIGANTVFKFGYQDELEEQMQARLYDSATRDPLTQAFNRRYFNERLASEWAFAKRHRSACALVAMDADHFKRVNDTYGHQAGDYVLKTLVQVTHRVVRKEDLLARVGGEEFMVLARGTQRPQAIVLAERIRVAIEAFNFEFNGTRLTVTVSLGVATSDDFGIESPEEMLGRADEFLYRAKENGRNRVEPTLKSVG